MNIPKRSPSFILILFVVLPLFACAPTPTAQSPKNTQEQTTLEPSTTPTEIKLITPTPTDLPRVNPSSTPTASPTATITPEPQENTCEEEICYFSAHFLLSRPIGPQGRDYVDPSYRYGSTQNGLRETHHGVEFVNSQGTSVLAAADGTVVFAGNDN